MFEDDIVQMLNFEKSIVSILDRTHPQYDEIVDFVATTLNANPKGIFSLKASVDGAFPDTHRVCFLVCTEENFQKLTKGGEEKFGNSEKLIFLDGNNTSLRMQMNKLGIKIINNDDIVNKLKYGN